MKLENVFDLVLVSFSAIGHILISEIRCIMYQDISRALVSYFRAESVIFLGLHTVRFPVVTHAGNVYVFCACVTIKKGGDSNIY